MLGNIKNRPRIRDKIINRFIDDVASQLEEYDGKLVFLKSKRFGDLKTVGEFNNEYDVPTIKVAKSRKLQPDDPENWLYTLVHETGHFDQWLKNNSIWTKFENSDFEFKVLFNKKYPKSKRNQYCKLVVDLELDCEKRAVKLMKTYKLPINTKKYIQQANLILYKWGFTRESAKWVAMTDKQHNQIAQLCPDTFQKSYLKIPKRIKNIFYSILSGIPYSLVQI